MSEVWSAEEERADSEALENNVRGEYEITDSDWRPLQWAPTLKTACLSAVDALLRVKSRHGVRVFRNRELLFSLTMDKTEALQRE